jgi:hypothetical protein
MTGANRILLAVLPLAATAIAFWLLMLSPQRQEASDLETQVTDLQIQVDEQEQLAADAEAAREDFPRAYRRLVVLGKAAPEDDDTSSLLLQLNRIASSSGVAFVSLEATEGGGEAAAPAPAAPQPPPDPAASSGQTVGQPSAAPLAPPSEATAALLPIGATIGPAGLPVMKYSLTFEGDFFRLADFLAGIDDLVKARNDGSVGVRGRLVTVDRFELTPVGSGPSRNPVLSASFEITTFLTPADEGATAGASPAGPAPVANPQPPAAAEPSESATASTATP